MKGLIIIVNFEQELEIRRFLEQFADANPGLDAVVVDDGSRDSSPAVAESLGYRVIRHQTNRGVGAAIRTGINYAIHTGDYEYVVILSSNGKMRPSEIPTVIRPILDERADYVQGTRFAKHGRALAHSPFRRAAIPAYSLVASAILGRRFTDITCGFRAYRLDWIRNPRINLDQGWLDRYEAELYIHYYACRLRARIV